MISFGYPFLLLGALALLIPLFLYFINLQSYKKQYFNYVRLIQSLKDVNTKRVKPFRLLILLNRLLLLICVVLIFSGLYFKSDNKSVLSKIIGSKSFVLDNAAYSEYKHNENETILENNIKNVKRLLQNDNNGLTNIFTSHSDRKVSATSLVILNDFLSELNYSFTAQKPEVKIETNNLIIISGFNSKANWWKGYINKIDTNTNIYLLKNDFSIEGNIFIDSLIIQDKFSVLDRKIFCKIYFRNEFDQDLGDFSCRVFHQERLSNTFSLNLISKTSIEYSLIVEYNPNEINRYRIEFDDGSLSFDNVFYFSLDPFDRIKVLVLTENESVVNNIFKNSDLFEAEFSILDNAFNRTIQYDLIVVEAGIFINKQLTAYINKQLEMGTQVLLLGGDLGTFSLRNYKEVLSELGIPFQEIKNLDSLRLVQNELIYSKEVNNITKNIFEDQNYNPGLVYARPIVDLKSGTNILEVRNGISIINTYSIHNGELIVYNTFFSDLYSTLHKSSLFLPTLYELFFRKSNQINQQPYFTQCDEIILQPFINNLSSLNDVILSNGDVKFIPQMRFSNSAISLTVPDEYIKPSTYFLIKSNDTIAHFSYNLPKEESYTAYLDIDKLKSQYSSKNNVYVTNASDSNTKEANISSVRLLNFLIIVSLCLSLFEIILLRYSDL